MTKFSYKLIVALFVFFFGGKIDCSLKIGIAHV